MTNFGPFDPDLVELSQAFSGYDVRSVKVYVIGGGTRGKSYANNYWGYSVEMADGTTHSGTNLFIARPVNHLEAAWEAAARFEEES